MWDGDCCLTQQLVSKDLIQVVASNAEKEERES